MMMIGKKFLLLMVDFEVKHNDGGSHGRGGSVGQGFKKTKGCVCLLNTLKTIETACGTGKEYP